MHAIEALRLRKAYGQFVALDNISFNIEAGTTLGLIGRNGAGKSTVLKILSGLTKPTSGRAILNGRVASILEFGAGFHPDLTGRENVFLKGHMQGAKRKQIESKFDEIVHFSELEKFIDNPVKNYSSGMYLRLAFSVFAHLDSDIILMDEVMAVGDAGFRLKSAKKIRELSEMGTTMVMANHDVGSVLDSCTNAIYLSEGKVIDQGNTEQVVASYYQREKLLGTNPPLLKFENFDHPFCTIDGTVKLFKVKVGSGVCDSMQSEIDMSSSIEIQIELEKFNSVSVHDIVIRLENVVGQVILQDSPLFHEVSQCHLLESGKYQLSASIPANLLNFGWYYLSVYVAKDQGSPELFEHILKFEVNRTVFEESGVWNLGNVSVRPRLHWDMTRL